jgi:transcriptional regulator with XRE-family HTH domain
MEDLPQGNIGPAVRRAREARGLTQQTLATSAGIALRTLIRIEQGEDMRIGTLTAIADVLGVSLSDLVSSSAA